MPVDTLYYIKGNNLELNSYVQTHADMLQALMGDRLFDYTMLCLPQGSRVQSGMFCCCTLPEQDGRQEILTRMVDSVAEIEDSLLALADDVYHKNINILSEPILPCGALFSLESSAPSRRPLFSRSISFSKLMPSAAIQEIQHEESQYEETSDSVTNADSLRDLAQKIRDEILQLQRMNGINMLVSELGDDFIKSLTTLTRLTPAPLVIDEKFKIYIHWESAAQKGNEYEEVVMPTLSRVVYLLFIRHTEGIRLKEIADYSGELLNIYLTISPRGDIEQMKRSIEDLTDPESGSLNQKISRITSAFRELMPSDLAQHYIITGPRGETRRILLDRSKVSLPQELC